MQLHIKSLLASVLMCFALVSASRGELAKSDSSLRFTQNLQAGRKQTVVVYGTSLSATSEWPKALSAYLNQKFPGQVTFVNSAESGRTSVWGVENLNPKVVSKNPDLVYLEFAANDAATKHRISKAQSEANVALMIEALRNQNPKVEIVLQMMNPAWDAADHADQKFYASSRPKINEYNKVYRKLSRKYNVYLLDHYQAWVTLRDESEAKFKQWLPDGLHPTPEASLAVTWPNVRDMLERVDAEHSIAPMYANVPYGEHERQVLDFWKAQSDKPTPLVFYIHGGGWVRGDKSEVNRILDRLLQAEISVAAINYRYCWQAQIAGVKPPIEWPMHDAARALQFVRSKSAEWNINRERVAVSGTSAGGCTSLWLAFHDDLAEVSNTDIIARQSTRVSCVVVNIAQTSLDPQQMKKWTPNSRYGGHAFGFMDPDDLQTRDTSFDEFLRRRNEILPWIREYSPMELTSYDDPPVILIYGRKPDLEQKQRDPTHTANFGFKLKEKLVSLGASCELVCTDSPGESDNQVAAHLIEKLKE